MIAPGPRRGCLIVSLAHAYGCIATRRSAPAWLSHSTVKIARTLTRVRSASPVSRYALVIGRLEGELDEGPATEGPFQNGFQPAQHLPTLQRRATPNVLF